MALWAGWSSICAKCTRSKMPQSSSSTRARGEHRGQGTFQVAFWSAPSITSSATCHRSCPFVMSPKKKGLHARLYPGCSLTKGVRGPSCTCHPSVVTSTLAGNRSLLRNSMNTGQVKNRCVTWVLDLCLYSGLFHGSSPPRARQRMAKKRQLRFEY